MNEIKINEKLSVLDGRIPGNYCATTKYTCGGKNHNPNCCGDVAISCGWRIHVEALNYCGSIFDTTKLATKFGIKFYQITISFLEIEVVFMFNIVDEDFKMRKLRIVPKGDDIHQMECYARAALLLECCVLEGLA